MTIFTFVRKYVQNKRLVKYFTSMRIVKYYNNSNVSKGT